MNVNTYNATAIYDEVINVAKAPRLAGRIFKDEHEGYWYELQPDGFMVGDSAQEAAEFHAKRPGVPLSTLESLQETYPDGRIVSTP